jgi:virginiamycin A acetyltransferase
MKSFIHDTAFVGKNAILNHPVHISKNAEVHDGSSVGQFSFVNVDSVVYRNVTIGKFCSFGRNIEIGGAEHPIHFLSTHSFQYNKILFQQIPEYCFPRKVKHLYIIKPQLATMFGLEQKQ